MVCLPTVFALFPPIPSNLTGRFFLLGIVYYYYIEMEMCHGAISVTMFLLSVPSQSKILEKML